MQLTLAQIHQLLPASRIVGDPQLTAARVHTDSRSVEANDLFVALRGDTFDAHDFLPSLPASGVKLAIANNGLAAAGLAGVEVDDIACTSKTLPEFPALWEELLSSPKR